MRQLSLAKARATTEGARRVIAGALRDAHRDLKGRRLAAAGRHLAVAWTLRGKLVDDRAVRELLAKHPGQGLPHQLLPAHRFELAQRAFSAGRYERARALLTAPPPPGRGLTGARRQILSALTMVKSDPRAARLRLVQVANRRLPGMMGRALRGFARLTAASIDYDAGRYREAIDGYLDVTHDSGYWRLARTGLAWCQYHNRHPDRSVSILKRLPGGLAGDPERALLAAVALHQLGAPKVARLVVKAALERQAQWLPAHATESALIAMVRREDTDDLPETLVTSLAADAQLRSLSLETLKAHAAQARRPKSSSLAWYANRVRMALSALLATKRTAAVARVTHAVKRLRVLLPQLK